MWLRSCVVLTLQDVEVATTEVADQLEEARLLRDQARSSTANYTGCQHHRLIAYGEFHYSKPTRLRQ